jgi:hypothetical protein
VLHAPCSRCGLQSKYRTAAHWLPTMALVLRRCLLAICVIAALASHAIADVLPLPSYPNDPSFENEFQGAPKDGAPRTAALFSSWFGGSHAPVYDSLPGDVTPHPAVARIIVPEDGSTAFGSGTLVGVHGQHGLVVTNWHVVRDAAGLVDVVFPDGFHSHATPLKVDQDWDLAALVVWKPNAEPVKIAAYPPRPGDLLTIHGYGRGKYRVATGRCTNYYSPQPNFPHEMVELDVEARQGDSGGPIFNQQGELAGVLFGAGQGTTMGSFAPRVRVFLAAVAPDFDQATATSQVAVADRAPPTVNMPGAKVDDAAEPYPSSPWSPPTAGRNGEPAGRSRASGTQLVSTTVPKQAENRQALTLSDLSRAGWYDPLKTALAAVGLVVLTLRLVKFVR